MNKKIGAVSLIVISEKQSNKKDEVLNLSDDMTLLNTNPSLSEFINLKNPSKLFIATERFRFFRTKDKKTIFQRCFRNAHSQIVWKEMDKVCLILEEDND